MVAEGMDGNKLDSHHCYDYTDWPNYFGQIIGSFAWKIHKGLVIIVFSLVFTQNF